MGWKAGRARLVQWLLGALATYIPSSNVQSHSSVSEFLANSCASKDAVDISVIYPNH
jgi:hypothetical protein